LNNQRDESEEDLTESFDSSMLEEMMKKNKKLKLSFEDIFDDDW
jgi:hypothetical protein